LTHAASRCILLTWTDYKPGRRWPRSWAR
jgi:hypothetical protein